MNVEKILTVHVLTKPDSLDQAIGIFEQQGFDFMKRVGNRFSIKGKLSLHQEKLGYDPETNIGNVPVWAQDLICNIMYPVRPGFLPEVSKYL